MLPKKKKNLFCLEQVGETFWERVPKSRIIFGVILSRVDTRVYHNNITNYFSDAIAPLTGRRPGQLPGRPAR